LSTRKAGGHFVAIYSSPTDNDLQALDSQVPTFVAAAHVYASNVLQAHAGAGLLVSNLYIFCS
jgi:hypothetical protein